MFGNRGCNTCGNTCGGFDFGGGNCCWIILIIILLVCCCN